MMDSDFCLEERGLYRNWSRSWRSLNSSGSLSRAGNSCLETWLREELMWNCAFLGGRLRGGEIGGVPDGLILSGQPLSLGGETIGSEEGMNESCGVWGSGCTLDSIVVEEDVEREGLCSSTTVEERSRTESSESDSMERNGGAGEGRAAVGGGGLLLPSSR